MIYIKTNWHIPFYNLAMEEYIITQLPEGDEYLFFYIHTPSIIIGRHQNTIEEINREYVEANNITVARRLSGGGAVYHDQGNLNYSIITSKQDGNVYDFTKLSAPILNAVSSLGVNAKQSCRNDLTIDGRKFSGSAQYSNRNRLLHHGTLLFNSDLGNLQKALNVKLSKIESKGIKSTRSRVTNICEHLTQRIDIEVFREIVLHHLSDNRQICEHQLSKHDLCVVEKMVREKFSTWEWNWGESPQYTLNKMRRFPCGIIDLHIDVDKGVIRGLRIFGDFFTLKDISELVSTLVGVEFSKTSLTKAFSHIDTGQYISGLTNREFLSLLAD